MAASRNGNKEIVELILKYNPDIDALDNEGKTALMYAQENDSSMIIELLNSYKQNECIN